MEDRYLFKAKRSDWKELSKEEQWVIGHYVKTDGIPYIYKLQGNEMAQRIYKIDESTLCPCTGLHDIRKKVIFENDIVGVFSQIRGDYSRVGLVKYGQFNCTCCEGVYGWYFDNDGDIRDVETYEVLGNIFDNSELLEVD